MLTLYQYSKSRLHGFCILVTCLWSAALGAQTSQEPLIQKNWTLNSPESTTKNYIARDYINLKATETSGFSYSATTGQSFSAKIDPGLLFPPTDKTYKKADGTFTTVPTQGAVVGSIPGQFAVSPSGAATYTIPIEVPVGINGMQPQISINYNSQGGFGALGIGWDIAGGSAITRGGKSIYYDNTNSPVSLESDALYLDGQRLILLSGTAWVNGATYATEVENYSTIKFTNWGFILTTVDGKTIEYGVTTDSRIMSAAGGDKIFGWKLNKVTDTYGNSITYTYTDYGQYLSQINYSTLTVEFAYNHIMDVAKKSYISDFQFLQTKLLSSVILKSGSTVLRTMGFSYKSTKDNRLDKISLYANDNSKFKETVINWGAESSGLTISKIGSATDPWLNTLDAGKASMQFADINGDGHADRLEMWVGNSSENGHIIVYFYDSTHKTFENSTTASISFEYHDYARYQPQMIASDINNDGKAEVIFLNYKSLYVYKYDNTSGFLPGFNDNTASKSTETIFDTYDALNKIRLLAANVNNDRYNDVIIAYGYYETEFGSGVFYGSQSGLMNTTDYFTSSSNAFKYLEAGDFNADNKIDIYGSRYSSSATPIDMEYNYIRFKTNYSYFENSNNEYRNSGDLNGDGLTDILVLDKDEHKWYVYRNDGNFNLTKIALTVTTNTGAPYQLPLYSYNANHDQKTYFVDYDGDGLLDIISATHFIGYYTPTACIQNEIQFFRNKGDFKFEFESYYGPFEGKISNLNTVTDMNGDGIADFVIAKNKDNSTDVPFNYDYYVITMPQANRKNLVSSITNGMNQTESVTYSNFSNYSTYSSNEANASIRPLRAPLLLVISFNQSNGDITSYTYQNPLYHTEGKGFLGFTTVTGLNSLRNIKSVSNYNYDPIYYGMNLTNQTITTANGTTTISTNNQTCSHITIDANTKRYLPTVTEQIATDHFKGVEQKSVTDYSLYPNTVSQTNTIKNIISGSIDLTTTVVTTFTGPNGVTPYLPSTVTTTRTQAGQSDTQTKLNSYEFNTDPNKMFQIIKTTEIVHSNDETYKVITETGNPDIWGHMRSVTVKAKDQNGNEISRGSSVSYTALGRFIASKTDNMGVVTTYDWGNEIYSQLASETTTIGGKSRTTSYTYNSRGELVETLYPDGNRKTSVVQWAGSVAPAGAVYNIYSQKSGNASVTVWYDALGREIQKDTYGLYDNENEKKIIVTTEYYTAGENKGKVYRISEPYFEGDTFNWAATYNYAAIYGYVNDVTTPVGNTHTTINNLTTTVTSPEGNTITLTNATGQILTNTVNEKTVYYAYYPSGLLKTSTPQNGQSVTMKYNPQGKRISIIDPDAGKVRNEYNGWGEMTKEVQLIHQNQDSIVTLYYYDSYGRLYKIDRNNEITNYNFDTGNKSRINSIDIPNKNTQTYEYDALDRVVKMTEDITANGVTKQLVRRTEYDALGRVKKEIYPSGYYTVNNYDLYGNLIEVKDGAGRSISKLNAINALGQTTSILKGNKETTYEYDPVNHLTTSIFASGVIDYSYGYYDDNNLQWRADNIKGQYEEFGYDLQKRLTNWDVTNQNGQTTYNSIGFDENTGNITSKSDLGNFTLFYGLRGRPHALDSINGVPATFPTANLAVTYTDFKKIKTLTEGSKFYELSYGVDDQRRKSVYYANGVTNGATLTRYYMGNYEEEITGTNIRKIHYLSGAILIQNNGVDSLLYTYADAQGSLIALTDVKGVVLTKTVNGTAVEIGRFAYDPWGKRRDPNNWVLTDSRNSWIINRGYTAHEHMDAFGIINMNGRVYDPLTAQFFSPDPFIQAPDNWLNYNRYMYAFGNPFNYTDPSGYVSEFNRWINGNWKTVVTAGAAIVVGTGIFLLSGGTALAPALQVAAGILAATSSSITSNVMGTALNGGSFGDCYLSGVKGGIFGGMSAMATAGIGSIFGDVGSLGHEILRAGAHSLVQGTIAELSGGNFWQGAASGALASIGGSVSGALGIHSFLGTVAVTTISGGIGAYIGGARSPEEILFGMATGAIVGALNFGENYIKQKIYDKQLKAIYNAYPKGDSNNPNYVSRDELFKLIGGDLEKWYNEDPNNPNLQNTCALRLSKALNDAGFTIPKSNATFNGANGKNYFLTVDAITAYLSRSDVFGEPVLLTRGSIKNAIFWQSNCGWTDATGHVDIIYKKMVGSHFYNQCGTVSYWH